MHSLSYREVWTDDPELNSSSYLRSASELCNSGQNSFIIEDPHLGSTILFYLSIEVKGRIAIDFNMWIINSL